MRCLRYDGDFVGNRSATWQFHDRQEYGDIFSTTQDDRPVSLRQSIVIGTLRRSNARPCTNCPHARTLIESYGQCFTAKTGVQPATANKSNLAIRTTTARSSTDRQRPVANNFVTDSYFKDRSCKSARSEPRIAANRSGFFNLRPHKHTHCPVRKRVNFN